MVFTSSRDFFGEVSFSKPVKKAQTMLNGFNLNFVEGDHNIRAIQVDSDVESIIDRAVSVRIQLIFRDDSANEAVNGWVTVVVLAEV